MALSLQNCHKRRVPLVSYEGQQRALHGIQTYVSWALEPSRLQPPSLQMWESEVQVDGLVGVARVVRAEEASWNSWTSGARLFNNRVAHVVEVHIQGPADIQWVPWETRLEVNDPEFNLSAAASPEVLLSDLSYFAVEQERWVLEGDLVARTRAAGEFRSAWVAPTSAGLDGVIAFPLMSADLEDGGMARAEMHVLALRLTVTVEVEGQRTALVWVFD